MNWSLSWARKTPLNLRSAGFCFFGGLHEGGGTPDTHGYGTGYAPGTPPTASARRHTLHIASILKKEECPSVRGTLLLHIRYSGGGRSHPNNSLSSAASL